MAAMRAGLDIDLPDGQAYANLPQALAAGQLTQTQIDAAARRVLRVKLEAGLFEPPYAMPAHAIAITGNAEALVLLKKTTARCR